MARKKQSITEELKNVDPQKIRYLRAAKIPQNIMNVFPGAQLDIKDKKIVVKGLPGEVTNIKVSDVCISLAWAPAGGCKGVHLHPLEFENDDVRCCCLAK